MERCVTGAIKQHLQEVNPGKAKEISHFHLECTLPNSHSLKGVNSYFIIVIIIKIKIKIEVLWLLV